MSATINADAVANYLGDCPILHVPGRLHTTEIIYATKNLPLKTDRTWVHETATLVRQAARDLQLGRHLLVFLPGRGEIARVHQELAAWADANRLRIFDLHGQLSLADQTLATAPLDGESKILLATNIAETSLTIDGVDTVVDTGLARINTWSAGQTFSQLRLARISRASATQRMGRAGRQFAGRCFRQWTPLDERALAPFETPEIRRTDLSETVLFLATQGVRNFAQFSWFEAPPEAHLDDAIHLLQTCGALSPDHDLTNLGRAMAQLPLSPRLARVALAARELNRPNQTSLAATLAALLSERDLCSRHFQFDAWRANFASDIELRLTLLAQAEASNFRGPRDIDLAAAQHVCRVRNQILAALRSPSRTSVKFESETIARLLWSGFADRLCRLRGGTNGLSARSLGGRGIEISGAQLLGDHMLFLALDGIEASPDAQVRLTHPIAKEWLAQWEPNKVQVKTNIIYDEDKSQLTREQALSYGDLALEEPRSARASATEAAPYLPKILRQHWPRLLQKREDLQQWFERIEFLRVHCPQENWPEWTDAILQQICEAACMGETSLAQIENKGLIVYGETYLSNEQRKYLEREAPERMTVPSGKSHPIIYITNQAPYLKVRLQELFGLETTPRLAKGQVALVFHILGPNYRPVQVTADLGSFWKNVYPEVRKELRARYPKHKWP
jgi:ATP-dependent helicase HrpB